MENLRSESPTSAAVYAPIGSDALVDRVRRRLQDAMATGVLRPADRLPGETVLATRFRVSLVTVREALQQLRATGFIVTRQGRGGGSFVDIDPSRATELIDARLRGLSRSEIYDFGTYYRGITDAVIRTIAEMRLQENLVAYRDTFLRAEDTAVDGPEARSVHGSLDLRLAGESQSVRLVHEQIRIQNDFAALLWMSLDEESPRAEIFGHNRTMLDAMIADDPTAAIVDRKAAVELSLQWLLDRRSQAQRHARGRAD